MTERRYRIVLVNYLNTLPMLEGIRAHLGDRVELILAHPADCAGTLLRGEADYGLVPVGALLERTDWRRVTGFGIGCDGPVDTVCLFGERPMEEWSEVLLDYQSRTSVLLTRYLLHTHWNRDLPLRPAEEGYEHHIRGNTGGLIIGDRAFGARKRFPFHYDLGEAWKIHTGLPFVFALWVSRAEGDPAFEAALNQALAEGVRAAEDIARRCRADYPDQDLAHYFRHSIRYALDDRMLEGFERFRLLAAKGRHAS